MDESALNGLKGTERAGWRGLDFKDCLGGAETLKAAMCAKQG